MKRRMVGLLAVVMAASGGQARSQVAAPLINPAGPSAGKIEEAGGTPGGVGAMALNEQSDVNAVLDALHQRGIGLKDFVADVSLAETDALTGDTTTNRGKVVYQAREGENARLRVVFDQRQIGKRIERDAKVEYVLDGEWLLELDHKRKLRVDRQVLQKGEKMNLFELGKGPFPLPIGQPKEKVLEMFDVSKVAAKPGDPAGTAHVQLKPKAGTRFARRFKTFDVWVDAKTNFPKKIETMDPNQTAIRATEFTNIVVNGGVKDGEFAVPQVQGWDIKREPLEE